MCTPVVENDTHILFSAAVKKKPSSCLKEVEKIKQKREERRAAHQALRNQQELEYDTTAPNWEFGAMIRSATSLGNILGYFGDYLSIGFI